MATLSAENKYILNRYFGYAGRKAGLGDLMEDAMSTAVSELPIANTYVLVGNASGVGVAVALSGDVTIVADGTVTIEDDAITTVKIIDDAVTSAKILDAAVTSSKLAAGVWVDPSQMVLDFTTQACSFSGSGSLGVPAVTDNAVNAIICGPHTLYWTNINQQDIGVNYVPSSGLNIAGDQTDNDGVEVNCGSTTSLVEKVVDTDNFYFRAKVSMADVSGSDLFYIGLRKAAAHENTAASYTDFYAGGWNLNAATPAVRLISDLNGAASVDTDTTDTISDGEYLDVKIWQGDEARLLSCIELMAGVKATMNTHFADATEHTAGQQTALVEAAPTTVATLITAITEAIAAYVTHEADAVLADSWVYHIAQTSDDDSLASEVAPTTLAECVTRLNDLRTKLDLHVADDTAHTDGDSGLVTAGIPQAANTHCLLGINGALAVPTVAVAYNFDTGDTILPFIHLTQHGDLTEAAYLTNWEVVDVTTT